MKKDSLWKSKSIIIFLLNICINKRKNIVNIMLKTIKVYAKRK